MARTGLHVSEVVLGGGIVGGILVLPNEATRHTALERTVAAGIDWIDIGASYGGGKSEETIGQYLPHLSTRPRISTKFIVAPDDHADVAGAIERSLTQSLERLRRDRVDQEGLNRWGAFVIGDSISEYHSREYPIHCQFAVALHGN